MGSPKAARSVEGVHHRFEDSAQPCGVLLGRLVDADLFEVACRAHLAVTTSDSVVQPP
jgi:hypothetical protein